LVRNDQMSVQGAPACPIVAKGQFLPLNRRVEFRNRRDQG
jgi:hypothetical protein